MEASKLHIEVIIYFFVAVHIYYLLSKDIYCCPDILLAVQMIYFILFCVDLYMCHAHIQEKQSVMHCTSASRVGILIGGYQR